MVCLFAGRPMMACAAQAGSVDVVSVNPSALMDARDRNQDTAANWLILAAGARYCF
jgi:hypothetical protein